MNSTNFNTSIVIAKKGEAFSTQLRDALSKKADINETITAMKSLYSKSPTLTALLKEQRTLEKAQLGFILGFMKAWLDTLPEDIARTQKINGIPVDLLIKLKVDENVLNILEEKHSNGFWKHATSATEYFDKYRRLSEMICGYGYNMYFIQRRYEEFYPNGMHNFVSGFANGYSNAFQTICVEAGIDTQKDTDPVEQDIWKNWPYFCTHDCHEYRIDGKYLFMYHGGATSPKYPNAPYGNNLKLIKQGVYEKLQVRTPENFSETAFNFVF